MFHENFLKKKKKFLIFFVENIQLCVYRERKITLKKKKNLDKDSYLSEKMKAVSVNDERRKREWSFYFYIEKKKKKLVSYEMCTSEHYNIGT